MKEQLEALTSYQLHKTSRDPETQAYYQHLQVVSTKVGMCFFPSLCTRLINGPRNCEGLAKCVVDKGTALLCHYIF